VIAVQGGAYKFEVGQVFEYSDYYMKDPIRKKIKAIEARMMKEKAALSKLRDKAKPELVQDYELTSTSGKKVKLSSLFGKKKELILIHNMGSSCPYCTLWADSFNGVIHHLQDRAAFVIETPDRPKTIAAFKKKRGWKFEMVSSMGTPFRSDLGYHTQDFGYWPGVSTFVKKNGKIYRHADSVFGPGDNYCGIWDLFDLLPGKSTDWDAKFKY